MKRPRSLWIGVVVAVATSLAACGEETETKSDTQTVNSSNGIWSNGIWSNGIWSNGIWSNGIWSNGIWSNGIWSNGIWSNGIWSNGIWSNGANSAALETLRTNPYTRVLLQYIYSCAMPATHPDNTPWTTTIDPGRQGNCSVTTATSCVSDSECPSEEVCLGGELVLTGAIGVGINANGTQADWDSPNGTCDETCQRWVSACLLARTNAYGKKVPVSLRAPANAPQAIKDALALATSPPAAIPEEDEFQLREGAYYGNLFATTPIGGEPETVAVESTPELYACAGPGSNIPSITYRFCSSQGDACPINTVASCINPVNPQYSACNLDPGLDPDGVGSCKTAIGGSDVRNEVITVYLKEPMPFCGNAVCEIGETSAACPTDCHPDTWAKSINLHGQTNDSFTHEGGRKNAVAPDGSMAVIGYNFAQNPYVDFGGGPLPWTTSFTYVVQYKPNGDFDWDSRIDSMSNVHSVAADSLGNIIVVGDSHASGPNNTYDVQIAKFSPTGTLLWSKSYGVVADDEWVSWSGVAVDGGNNIIITGAFEGTTNLGGANITAIGQPDTFVAKYDSNGDHVWSKTIGDANYEYGAYIAANAAGQIAVRFVSDPDNPAQPGPRAYKLVSLTPAGVVSWTKESAVESIGVYNNLATHVEYTATAVSSTGEVIIVGIHRNHPIDFGGGPINLPEAVYFARYAADGSFLSVKNLPGIAGQATSVRLDPSDNVLLTGYVNTGSNLGAGPIDSEGDQDVFLALYTPGGEYLWAKQFKQALHSPLGSAAFDNFGNLRVRGFFDGSMLLDNMLLVNSIPELQFHGDLFIGKFKTPCSTIGCDTTPPTIANTPIAITMQATSAAGANVKYPLPTAVDNSFEGTNVACVPAPNTVFPIGPTTVTCSAYDVHGNFTTSSFVVTVHDNAAPVMVMPQDITATAGSPAGVAVNYTPPTATDQLAGDRPVTCLPAPGSTFPVGTNQVTCTASDNSNNTTTGTFNVVVTLSNIAWSGVLEPINADGSSVFKLGSTVIVKFTSVPGLTATLSYAKVAEGVPGIVNEPISNSAPDNGNQFRESNPGEYIFNLSTKAANGFLGGAGQYILYIDLGDGVERSVLISLKP